VTEMTKKQAQMYAVETVEKVLDVAHDELKNLVDAMDGEGWERTRDGVERALRMIELASRDLHHALLHANSDKGLT